MADGLTVYVSKPVAQQDTVGRVDLNSTTSTYSVIKSDDFENRRVELSQLIENETGVQVRSSGGVGGFSIASIRGSSSEQVTVYIDGVPLNKASGGAVDLSLISMDNVESVELYRGSVPMELGNASLGGAINIITRQTTEKFKGKFKATVGSFNTQQYNVFTSAATEKNSFIVSASLLKSDNDFEFINDNGTPENPDDDRNEKRNNSSLEQATALAKWKYRINNDSNVDTKLEWLSNDQQIPGQQNNVNADALINLSSIDFFTQYNQKKAYFDADEFSIKGYVGGLNEVFSDTQSGNALVARDVDASTQKYGSELFYKFKSDGYQLKYRLLFEQQSYTSENVLTPVTDNVAREVAVQDSTRDYYEQVFEYKNFSLQNSLISSFSLRHIYAKDDNNLVVDIFGRPIDVGDKKYNIVTPQMGAKYKFNALTYMNFNAGAYVRLPSFFELFGSQGYFRGSPVLKEESGVNIDVGYVYSLFKPGSWLDDAKFYLGFFHNTVDNLIVREPNAQGIVVARNVASGITNGVEANFKLYPDKHWLVLFNVVYLNDENTSETTAYNGKRLPGQFKQDYNLQISYSSAKWVTGISWDVKKDMYFDRPNLLKATDISDINLSVLRKWKNQTLELKAENLLNNQYENFRFQPTAGTSYFLTYTYKL